MAGISFKLEGLETLREEFKKESFDKKLIPAIGLFATELHASLRFAVKRNYTIDKSLDSVLIGNTSSQFKKGRNLLANDISYKDENLRLAEFPTTTFLGNINSSASKEGKVAQVSIRRGRTKIVYGKKHYGGFLQKRPASVVKKNIFERLQSKTWQNGQRLPFKPLYAIGLAKMAVNMYEYDSQVQRTKEKLYQELLKVIG